MKQCKRCGDLKCESLFSVSKSNKDGLRGVCKACVVKATQEKQRTLVGLVKKIYNNQKMTTKHMKRDPPDYTEEMLLNWMLNNGYSVLFQNWVASGYDKWKIPSIDRLDNNKSYSLNNIQLVTWAENLSNQKIQNHKGIYLHSGSKAVNQLTLDGTYIKTFGSIAMAMRELTGKRTSVSNISGVCEGRLHTAYGYLWEYALS